MEMMHYNETESVVLMTGAEVSEQRNDNPVDVLLSK